jgi:hypothetical protein
MCDLDHPVLADAKKHRYLACHEGDLQHAFPLDVPMVASSAFIITANSERLRCGVFSIHETIHLGNFEFIVDYFSGLSLYPRRGNAGASFMGSAHSEASTPRWAMVEDSDEEYLMASSGEGSSFSSEPHH